MEGYNINMKRLLFTCLSLIFVLVSFIPSTAYASEKNNDKDKPVPVSCTLSLSVADPGTLSMTGNVVETTGEKTFGKLDCNLKAMDGDFATVHSSRITFDPVIPGSFSGSLTGTFTLSKNNGKKISTGKMTANISGNIIGVAPNPFPPPALLPVHRVIDNGKWELDGKIEAKGTFTITLVGIVGVPATLGGLSGSGAMQGVAEKD